MDNRKYLLVNWRTRGVPVPDENYPEYNAGYDDIKEGFSIVSEEEFAETFNDSEVFAAAFVVAQLPADSDVVKAVTMHDELIMQIKKMKSNLEKIDAEYNDPSLNELLKQAEQK